MNFLGQKIQSEMAEWICVSHNGIKFFVGTTMTALTSQFQCKKQCKNIHHYLQGNVGGNLLVAEHLVWFAKILSCFADSLGIFHWSYVPDKFVCSIGVSMSSPTSMIQRSWIISLKLCDGMALIWRWFIFCFVLCWKHFANIVHLVS